MTGWPNSTVVPTAEQYAALARASDEMYKGFSMTPPTTTDSVTFSVPALLPCPFCGGRAYATDTEDMVLRGTEWLWTWEVECEEGCIVLARANSTAGKFVSEAEAVAAWNRRTPTPPKSAPRAPGECSTCGYSPCMCDQQ